ncbi:MAG: HNH endonuclease, partial [Rhodobacteraceae bacterium]|nr:HNH endonuclease [Paracoccaceae bacterium]
MYTYQLLCVAYQGVLPREDEVVRHSCHNRRCINSEHLQLGTQQDNIHDE